MLSKQFLQSVWTPYGKRVASDVQKFAMPNFASVRGSGFAGRSELRREHAFGPVELDFDLAISDRARAAFQQPVGHARLHVFQSEIRR